jgi:hypothetical protein
MLTEQPVDREDPGQEHRPPSLPARIAPALLLVVLAPVIAEFLLGDFSIRSLPLVLVFLPQYGCGALLVREVARRTGRGWPTMLLLAVAYALVEEGFTTQSLFNPNYARLRLLDYGYVPALGTSLNWSLFVLSIHVVWSISTPILIAEGVAAERRTTPWLRRPGLAITAALFVLGCVLTTSFSLASHFVASVPQFAAVAVLVVAAVVAAFTLFRPSAGGAAASTDRPPPPSPWLVGVVSFALATAFELIEHFAQGPATPAVVGVLGMLACEVVAIVLIARWSRRPGWGPHHYLAIATGTVLTYTWVGLRPFLNGHTNLGASTDLVDVAGQVVETLVSLALIGWAVMRTRERVSVRASTSLAG